MTRYQPLPDLPLDQYERLKADIARHGIQVPVEVHERGHLLDGHHRVRIAKELGIEDVPVTYLIVEAGT